MSTNSPAGFVPHSFPPALSDKASLSSAAQTARPAKNTNNANDQLQYARQIIEMEARALEAVSRRLDDSFTRAVDLIYRCTGSVIVSGIGKAGLIGQKIAATLASTGSRSHFLHPTEAIHGDLGRIHHDDVVLMLSQSGDTEEVVRLLPSIRQIGTPLVAITGRVGSKLGQSALIVIDIGPLQEACSLGLAPSTSTTAMLAVGDALALVTSRMRGFSRDDFARFHPGGSLGRQLARVDDCMRRLSDCRLAVCTRTVREVLIEARLPARRTGAIMIVDHAGKLRGIFTDSDLARLFESRRDALLDGPIRNVMTSHPTSVPQGSMMNDAVAIMAERRISELPVVDTEGKPVGLLDITDIVALYPEGLAVVLAAQSENSSGVPRPKNAALLKPPSSGGKVGP
ncbi:MAG TPA: KpsF/GutQ family sugar-phosphate isomerase [Pirellulales bacterium]|nr:KpsF/GutQ family sugar-phosphate isomerase [Pirellulales bacterium]